MKEQTTKVKDFVKCFLISILVVIGTFPNNDWSFSNGIDPPLAWVFNYLFENGLDIGKHIIFPHGPLAFFMYPLQENILLSTLVTSIFKVLLVFNLFFLLTGKKEEIKWIASFGFAYFFSIILGFNHLVLTNILLLYCNFFISEKNAFKYLAFAITAFAFYVKAYVGIVSVIIFFSFTLYYFFKSKSIKQLIIDGSILISFIVIIWLLMYGTLSGFLRYLWGVFQLAQDNSSAAAWHPFNNWFILSFFFILIALLFTINRTKKSIFYFTLICLSLFAAWKHGMAREDISHIRGFYNYTLICLSIYVIYIWRNVFISLVILVSALFLFSINMKNSLNYSTHEYEVFRVNNFIEFITEFSELKQDATNKINKEMADSKLPQRLLDKISTSTIDVYPWQYSVMAANRLNWQPRVILHSYASYTTWLDKENAKHFLSDKSPEYIIIEKNSWANVNGGEFSSIDSRYFFNDEPITILTILKKYEFSDTETKYLLLKKRQISINETVETVFGKELKWGEWLEVPENNNDLLRAKLSFNKSFLQFLKSFFYKDEQFWVYFQLNNGTIHKYRIVPKNAADGIWINPYLFNTESTYRVKKIMFKASTQSILANKINVNWEYITFMDSPNHVFSVLNAPPISSDSTIFYSLNNFETTLQDNWSEISNDQLSNDSYQGLSSHVLKPNSFTSTFSMELDSIPFQNLKITSDCWIKTPGYKLSNNISLVISVEDSCGIKTWKGIPIDYQLIDNNQWNNIYNFINYKHSTKNCKLKVYVWNLNSKEILIDNFNVQILK